MSIKSLVDLCILSIDGTNYQPFLINFETIKQKMHLLWDSGKQAKLLNESIIYTNGKKLEHHFYKDGLKHGISLTWYKSGEPHSKGVYKNGKIHGPFTLWYDNCIGLNETDNIAQKYYCVNGIKHGKWTTYYKSGGRQSKCICKDGKAHGPLKTWNKDGNLIDHSIFENGTLVNVVRSWY